MNNMKKLLLNVISIIGFLLILSYVLIKFFGYSGLIETILNVMLFLLLFFTLVLIFIDKEKAKTFLFIFGLGCLAALLGFFG